MGIFDFIFQKKEKPQMQISKLKIEPMGAFTAYNRNAYDNDIYRGAVDAIARNIGKLKGSHIINYAKEKTEGETKLNRILQVRPNKFMSAFDFLYKLSTHYYLYNNSFAFIERDERGNVAGIFPLDCKSVQFLSDRKQDLYCRFFLNNGKQSILPYNDIIHLRRNFNSNSLLGDDNAALYPALELAHTQNEGIISGIKAGAKIRGILRYTQVMAPELLKAEKEAFINSYLQMNNDGGIITLDQKMDYQPIDNKPVILSAEQTQEIKNKIYSYLGISEKIVNSSYTEDEFAAFYESVVEPFAVALSEEFTAKIFTEREQAFGNKIIFESGRLQFASNKTKVELIKEILPLGLLSINQALEILNLPSIAGGEKRLQTLNMVDAEKAIEYQLARVVKKGGAKSDDAL